MKPITISEAVAELRAQIEDAVAARPDDGFTLEVIEAELQMVGTLTRSTEASGGSKVTFSLFGFGADAGAEARMAHGVETAHTVTLKLNVLGPGGRRVNVNTETDGPF